jgi:hypothetical protein
VEPVPDPANSRTLYAISGSEAREHTLLEQNAVVHLVEHAVNSHLANCFILALLREVWETKNLPMGELAESEIADAVRGSRGTLPPAEECDVPMLPAREARERRCCRRGAGPRRRETIFEEEE